MENGLPSNFLINLSDKQVDVLYKKYITEQPQPQVVSKTVKQIVLPSGSQTTVGGVSVSNTSGKVTVTPTTEEVKEDDQTDYDLDKSSQVDPYEDPNPESNEKGPSQYGVNPDADKSMNDGMGIMETKKKSKYNPWAICTSSVGRKDKEKYEKCVMDVKKSVKEGRDPYESLLENRILELVKSRVDENMQLVSFKKLDKPVKKMYTSKKSNPMEAAEPAVKPRTAPPKTKPGVKPNKPNPYQPPKETPKEKPKAQDYKSMFISTLNQLLGK